MGGANPAQAPGPTVGERISRDLEKGGGVIRDNRGNVIASQSPEQRARAEEMQRQKEFEARRRAELEFAKAQADAAARGGQTVPTPSYNRQPITPPGVSDTPGVPGTGRSPFIGRPSRSQQDNQRELARVAEERARQMAQMDQQMAFAKEQEQRLRSEAERNRANRGMEGTAVLEEERRRRAQEEDVFNRRLQEARFEADKLSRQPGRRDVSAAQRQSEMLSEFERARSEGKNYDISQFEARFGPQAQAGIAAPAPGEEGPLGILSYQELLDRLKQYQAGGI